MSINQFSSSDLQEQPHWWSHYTTEQYSSPKTPPSHHNSISTLFPNYYATTLHHSSAAAAGAMFGSAAGTTSLSFNLINSEEEEDELQVADDMETTNTTSREYLLEHADQEDEAEIPKKPLFEKPLTPSDVGKLNRLVIPKQHAERYFPMNGGGDNGLLLSFEDETGKPWKFRYSYWNSSQSYVLTKGWSRFVKEKKLDAGDIVVFRRHREDSGRLFIGWRRKNNSGGGGGQGSHQPPAAVDGGGCGWSNQLYSSSSTSLQYQSHDCHHAGSATIENQTTVTTSGNSKKLRLFGVNMEWHGGDESSEPATPDGSAASSQGLAHPYYNHQYYSNMDINFSGGDVHRRG